MVQLKSENKLKTKIKILITESFFPYLFLILTLLIALLVIDRKIDNQDDLVLVNLNREEVDLDDQPSILQKINLENTAYLTDKTKIENVNKINGLIEEKQWKAAISSIENITDVNLKNDMETTLTLAYLYYKKGEYQKGIDVLSKITQSNNPRYFYNMGLLYSKNSSNYSKAMKYFEKFLEYKNSSYEAYMNMGYLSYRSKHYDDAIKYFKKSEGLSSMERKAKALYWFALTQIKMQNIDGALESLNQAIHFDPEMVRARVYRAKLMIKSEPEDSLNALKKVAQAYPDYLQTYHVIADYYLETGEYEKSLYWLKKGLDNAPNSTKTKSEIGSIYLKLKEYQKAKIIFSELSEQFPTEAVYYFNLARSHFGLGEEEYPQAIENYKKSLLYRPNYYEVYINLGIVYAKLKQPEPEKALYYYNKAIELGTSDASVYYNMGVLYSKLDQKQAALNAYRKSIQLQANYPEAYFNMGIIFGRLMDYENSVKSYLEAIHYNKDYVNAYYNLANIYESRAEMNKAIQILNSGIENTQDLKLKNKLAQNYEIIKDNEKAQLTYLEILQEDPENKEALLNVSKLLLTLKKYQESSKYIDQYISANPVNSEARYVLMLDAYNLGKFDQAYNQWEILDRMSPNYKDSLNYKSKIISRMN
ncbi:MAG: tetratricopeptide repeat protein [Spirochaetia bacterium]|nr:tetratricopeptide repeat protein [Spirochaetia bacterium]